MKYLLIIEFHDLDNWPPRSEFFSDKAAMITRANEYERAASVHCKMFEIRRL